MLAPPQGWRSPPRGNPGSATGNSKQNKILIVTFLHQVAEYQREKAEREAAYEAEQEKIRIEKEREIARLRTLQERAKDEQAERDALRAKRAQEAVSNSF